MSKAQIAPCGLDCSACALFRASFDEAASESLVEWFKSEGWIGPDGDARAVMEKGPFCHGCRGDRSVHWSPDCEISACCVGGRSLENCSQCGDFSCDRLERWAGHGAHHRKALDVLRRLRSDAP